jgi:hypothetical protein
MIRYHRDLVQGSDEWHAARCGLLTASEMKLIVTPTLKPAANDKERAHLWELLAQRITGYVEPAFVSDDMLRGREDEIEARALYARQFEPVEECGFVTNDRWGFTIGCSPDGLVGKHGMIEIKSRRQKYHVETLLAGQMPADFAIQVQTALLVTGRNWCDFVSYCGGLPMVVLRVLPCELTRAAIVDAARAFEDRLAAKLADYRSRTAAPRMAAELGIRMVNTERRVEQEMHL